MIDKKIQKIKCNVASVKVTVLISICPSVCISLSLMIIDMASYCNTVLKSTKIKMPV